MTVANEIGGEIIIFNKGVPKTWNGTSPYHLQSPELHKADGFLPFVQPQYNPETHKRTDKKIKDGDTYTFETIALTPEEIEQRQIQKAKAEKEQKQYEIKEKYLKKVAENQIAFNPTDAVDYFPQWVAGSYEKDVKVIFKGKVFENTVDGNTNAPDKGGWIEKK